MGQTVQAGLCGVICQPDLLVGRAQIKCVYYRHLIYVQLIDFIDMTASSLSVFLDFRNILRL